MRNRIILKYGLYVLLVLTMGGGLITFLMAGKTKGRNEEIVGSFNRIFSDLNIEPAAVLNKEPSIWGIAGYSDTFFYFQGGRPDYIYRSSQALNKMDTIASFIPITRENISGFEWYVDSSYIWFFAKNEPGVYRKKHDSAYFSKFLFPKHIYTRIIPVSGDEFILRGFDTTINKNQQFFIKGDLLTGETFIDTSIVSSKMDGGFSTDGLLKYDPVSNILVYVPFYEAYFATLDTNMKMIAHTKTVDESLENLTETGIVKEGKEKGFGATGPKYFINKSCSVFDGRLYNWSTIRSKNEKAEVAKQNSVVDVYSLKNGAYENSFYIPEYENEKLKSFLVVKNGILALYKNNLVFYTIK